MTHDVLANLACLALVNICFLFNYLCSIMYLNSMFLYDHSVGIVITI